MRVEDPNYAGQRYEFTEVGRKHRSRRLTPEDAEWEQLTPLAKKMLATPPWVIEKLGEMGLTLDDVFNKNNRPSIRPEYYADPFKAEESDR